MIRATTQPLLDGTWLSTSASGCSGEGGPGTRLGALAEPCPTVDPAQEAPNIIAIAGQRYDVVGPVDPDQVGDAFTTTGCRAADGQWPDGYLRRGDTGRLPPGTELRQIIGMSEDQAVVAMTAEGPVRYEAVGTFVLPDQQ